MTLEQVDKGVYKIQLALAKGKLVLDMQSGGKQVSRCEHWLLTGEHVIILTYRCGGSAIRSYDADEVFDGILIFDLRFAERV